MKKDEPDVSLKINGKHVKEKTRSEQVQAPSNDFSIIDWNERRAAETEAAADREQKPNKNKKTGLPLKMMRKKQHLRQTESTENNPVSLYFISLTGGAAALGLLFGIMLLQFVSAGDTSTGAVIDDQEPPPITAEFNDSLTMYLVQAGAFTNKEKGVEMQNHLLDKGFPGILTYDGEFYYLFSGVSFQEKNSQRLLDYFEEEQVEVYEKTRTVPDPEATENNEEVTKQLLQAKQILTDTAEAVLDENVDDELVSNVTNLLEKTESWEGEKFIHLHESIEKLEEEWSKAKESSSEIQEILIESVLHYEEAVYAHNGVETDKQ
ncbi:hypothetical protein D7Z54_16600 [Salibacterium salarium]|uniref:SPOR domain-containing protein n=1 Tax=Salibacterium salarium TaxID=284579 RepID=A0A3R9RCH0_9BACI|nr:hypothetical protein [Salibacterium salarium]RSL32270.1 hypothetical protein D7Z54_16600 [Salibacterium salarium]